MRNVFRDCGFTVISHEEGGVVRVSLALGRTDEYAARHAARAVRAAHTSIKPFFEPRSVAVIGASRSRSKIGGQMFRNLMSEGFLGALYPVNPAAPDVEGVRSYASVTEIPGPVDLAVINRADPLFLKQILEPCRLLYGAPRTLAELKMYAFRRYQDHRRFLAMEREYVRRKLAALSS